MDLLAQRVIQTTSRDGEATRRALLALLGLDAHLADLWPSQADVARHVDVTRARLGQCVGKFQQRWSRDPAVTKLRSDIADILQAAGGVMSVPELSEAVLVACGSVQDEPHRSRLATAVTRAAVEVERTMAEPRFIVRRDSGCVLIAATQELAEYAFRLGHCADRLANEDPLAPPTRVLHSLSTDFTSLWLYTAF